MRNIKKILLLGITLFSLASCSNNDKPVESEDITVNTSDENKDVRYKIYLKAQESGFTGSYEDWLNSIRGADGKEIEISVQNDYLVWKYKGYNDWNNLLPIKDLIGPEGKPGNDGVSIKSIEKTKTEGLVDTYTITYSDGKTTTFTVTNGADGVAGESIKGEPGDDGHTPVIIIGENGNWFIDGVDTKIKAQGENGADGVSINKIEKTKTDGLVDTYTITYSDGKTTTFTVTNGAEGESIKGEPGDDGHTPVITIGENGNWFIDGVDTNFKAQGNSGKSAYEIYCEHHPEYKKSEAEWLDDLVNGRLGTKDTYTVSFNTNTELKIEPQEIKRGDKVKKPQIPVKEGYIFKGWFVGDEKWVFSGYSVSEDITLEAKFDKIIHEVQINYDNGSELSSIKIGHGEKLDIEFPNKVDSVFLYWVDETGNRLDENYVVNENISIKAVWEDINKVFAVEKLPDNTYKINKYIGNYSSIVIPNSVSILGNGAFANCTNLENLIIPNTVKEIEYVCFFGCSNLKDFVIPESVVKIDNTAFALCSSLTKINIPKSVTKMGYCVFGGCENIRIMTVDSENPNYDSRNNCNGVVDTKTNELISACAITTIPKTVTKLGPLAFYHCYGLESIIIPNNVTFIANEVFTGCKNLVSVSLPNSINSIESKTFEDCTKLTNVVIPSSVLKIDEYAFGNCDSLTSITIPELTTSIDYTAFSSCNSLEIIKVDENNPIYDSRDNCNAIIETKINKLLRGCNNTIIPENVRSIGALAFYGCSSLTSITIPKSVTSIAASVFCDCESLVSIKIDENNPIYDSRGNSNAIIETKTNKLLIGCKNTIIPEDVTSIGNSAFSSCGRLTSIIIPKSVTSIGAYAFKDCSSLTSIIIPKSVTSIGDCAFCDCAKLTINCEATSKPSGWDDYWNASDRTVNWGYKNK